MCKTVNTSFVLAHALKKHGECSISEITAKKSEIENAIPSVFVDVSFNSLANTCECYPEIFELETNRITKSGKADHFLEEPYINYFNNNLDASMVRQIVDML